jgi:hypothetical protein
MYDQFSNLETRPIVDDVESRTTDFEVTPEMAQAIKNVWITNAAAKVAKDAVRAAGQAYDAATEAHDKARSEHWEAQDALNKAIEASG